VVPPVVTAGDDLTRISATDLVYLRRAVMLSRCAAPGGGDLPFGAVVAIDECAVAEAGNEVGQRRDPTAHAEILALRAAAERLGRPDLPDAVLYCSSEPCPMCLAACYWAQIGRVVHAATIQDAAHHGFSDAHYYAELSLPRDRRALRIDAGGPEIRAHALAALDHWADG
jgi:tRNA(Arg) A34 adenosine deaminase TadA